MAKDYSEDLLIQKSTAELLEKNLAGSLCMLYRIITYIKHIYCEKSWKNYF